MPLIKNADILLDKRANKEKEPIPELIVCLERLSSAINTESFSEEENTETHTEVNFSLIHPFTEETITVKREPDDFDNRKTENEVNRDLDQKSSIQIHSHIKSEEEDFINSQYLISHEELNIKAEEDVEQSADTQFKNYTVKDTPKDQIKIHKCPPCPFQSKYKSCVKQHSVLHKKPDEIGWHRCTECPYKTNRKGDLKKHAIVHNETRQNEIFKCAHCVFETSWKHSLKQHLLVHRRENVPRMYCPEPECPYETHSKLNMKRHFLRHNDAKFFKCTQCPYQAKRQQYLKSHQLKHESTDKWHACPQCPYKTVIKSNLQKHILKHANPDQLEWYTCEQCPYKTYRNNTFKEHTLTHNKDDAKWLRCSSCSFKTLRRYCFNQHQIKHQEDDRPGWHKAAEQTDWLQSPTESTPLLSSGSTVSIANTERIGSAP